MVLAQRWRAVTPLFVPPSLWLETAQKHQAELRAEVTRDRREVPRPPRGRLLALLHALARNHDGQRLREQVTPILAKRLPFG